MFNPKDLEMCAKDTCFQRNLIQRRKMLRVGKSTGKSGDKQNWCREPRAGEIDERKKMSMEIMEKRKNWKRDKEDENKVNGSK